MGWVTPSTQSTGHKVTAAEWNELVNDFRYLKGLDGTATIQDGLITQELIPDANSTHDLGSNAARYRDLYLGSEAYLGDSGYLTGGVASGTSSETHLTRNAYYNAGWKRRVADADACALVLEATGDLVFYGSSDGNSAADSAITFTERFRITKAGKMSTGGAMPFVQYTGSLANNATTSLGNNFSGLSILTVTSTGMSGTLNTTHLAGYTPTSSGSVLNNMVFAYISQGASFNVYESGGALTLENKLGDTASYYVTLIGTFA